MQCPDCARYLKAGSRECGCGWTLGGDVTPSLPCAHEGCGNPASARQRTPQGWANFCHPHYMEFHRRSAVEWCNAHGLDTREKQLKFIREKSGVVFKHMEAF